MVHLIGAQQQENESECLIGFNSYILFGWINVVHLINVLTFVLLYTPTNETD